MNLLAVVGSSRKGKATDTLVDKAIEGALSKNPELKVKKIYLSDYNINYCKNCLACRDSKTKEPIALCAIRDDMDILNKDILDCDFIILSTPLHNGGVTAMLMTFFERICWTLAKPEGRYLTFYGCPTSRTDKKRKVISIITNGSVPPIYRIICDDATKLINTVTRDILNGKSSGSLYAGAIENRGVEYYFKKAYKLGMKLA